MTREQRIDIVRGLAIVTILFNHFAMAFRAAGFGGWEILTPTQLGYSSAASIFVALSGYMVGMVYMRRANPVRAVLRRALSLYLVNLAIFLLILPAALVVDPAHDRFWNLGEIAHDPLVGTVRFLTLQNAPAFLDVLQLYIVLMAATPLAIWLVRCSPWALVAGSLGLWAIIQLWPFLMPPGMPVPALGRTLNPLAWQMAFFLPMIAGMNRWHEPIFGWLARHGWATALIIAALIGFGFVHTADPPFAPWPIHLALTSRIAHGPVWTLHALLLLFGYLGMLVLLTPWLRLWPFPQLASLGRNSLNVYAASIPIIFTLALGLGRWRTDQPTYLAGTALTVLSCLAVARVSDRRKQRRKAESALQAIQRS